MYFSMTRLRSSRSELRAQVLARSSADEVCLCFHSSAVGEWTHNGPNQPICAHDAWPLTARPWRHELPWLVQWEDDTRSLGLRLPGQPVSNTSEWIRLPPIKDLTISPSFAFSQSLPSFWTCFPSRSADKTCGIYEEWNDCTVLNIQGWGGGG